MVFRNIVFTRLFKLRLNQNDTIVDLNSNLKKKNPTYWLASSLSSIISSLAMDAGSKIFFIFQHRNYYLFLRNKPRK